MLDNVKDFTENYKALHKTLPTNNIPYPFAFDPLPHGEAIPTKQGENCLGYFKQHPGACK
jgi:hypothetical protein